jgi:hypothetical protein
MAEFKKTKNPQIAPIKADSGKSSSIIIIKKIKPKDGWEPLPRRDHSCIFFKN